MKTNLDHQSRVCPKATGETTSKLLEDVTARASAMSRDSALLYPNRRPKNAESPHYWGVLKLESGQTYWAALWRRTAAGKEVYELRLSKKGES